MTDALFFLFSESKCIDANARSFCENCKSYICSTCAEHCHKGHNFQDGATNQKCGCHHNDPVVSKFIAMLKPNTFSKQFANKTLNIKAKTAKSKSETAESEAGGPDHTIIDLSDYNGWS